MKPRLNESGGRESRKLTRRNLLELAGLATRAAAFSSPSAFTREPAPQVKSPQSPSSVINSLSKYMSEAADRPLPEEITEKAKQLISGWPLPDV